MTENYTSKKIPNKKIFGFGIIFFFIAVFFGFYYTDVFAQSTNTNLSPTIATFSPTTEVIPSDSTTTKGMTSKTTSSLSPSSLTSTPSSTTISSESSSTEEILGKSTSTLNPTSTMVSPTSTTLSSSSATSAGTDSTIPDPTTKTVMGTNQVFTPQIPVTTSTIPDPTTSTILGTDLDVKSKIPVRSFTIPEPTTSTIEGTSTPQPVLVDHYLGYEAKTTKKTPKFEKVTVTLEDQFEKGTYKVEKTNRLFTPVNKNNEGISDDVTHLKGYEIKPFKDSIVILQSRAGVIEITNQFGTLLLGTEEPKLLLVPTAKDLENPVDELASTLVDHYKCYKVNVIGDFQTREPVTLEDQFLIGTFEVGEPNMLCNPVDKNGEGIINPDNHLVCYNVSENFKKTNIHTHDQFGPETLDIEEVKELCVPSEKKLIPEIHLIVIDSDGKRVKDVSCTFSQTTTGGGGGGGVIQGFTTDGKGFANLPVFPVLINGEPVDTNKIISCSKIDVGSASQIVILDEKLITNITLTLI